MATKALIECTSVYFDGCFFYIDRSRKVPPTFFLGEPQGLPLLYKQNEKENRAEITACDKGGYLLNIEIPDMPESLCKMQLYFPERMQAEMAKDGFLQNPTLLYAAIIAALTGDRSTLVTALSDAFLD